MSDRLGALQRIGPGLLLLLLAAAWVAPAGLGGLRLEAGSTTGSVDRWQGALDGLEAEPIVLVGFDPDLGTYPEIRPTVRAAIADLLSRNARLAFVALTPEGRALLLAELGRLERLEANPARILDLGFVPGAEAAIVSLAAGPVVPSDTDGALARTVRDEGLDAVAAVLVVGGNDLGPRSWVEQFAPRVPGTPLLAIGPTVLLPELQPYVETGQLAALFATPGDGATFRDATGLDGLDRLADSAAPRAALILAGLLVAIAVLGQAWLARLTPRPGGDGDGRAR